MTRSLPMFTSTTAPQVPLMEYLFADDGEAVTEEAGDHDALVDSLFPRATKSPTRVQGLFADPGFLHLPYEQQRTKVYALVREHGAPAMLGAVREAEADTNLRSRYSVVLSRIRRDIEDAHARTHPRIPLVAAVPPAALVEIAEMMPAIEGPPTTPWRASCFWLGYEYEKATRAANKPDVDPAVHAQREAYRARIPQTLAQLGTPATESADAARVYYNQGRAYYVTRREGRP